MKITALFNLAGALPGDPGMQNDERVCLLTRYAVHTQARSKRSGRSGLGPSTFCQPCNKQLNFTILTIALSLSRTIIELVRQYIQARGVRVLEFTLRPITYGRLGLIARGWGLACQKCKGHTVLGAMEAAAADRDVPSSPRQPDSEFCVSKACIHI